MIAREQITGKDSGPHVLITGGVHGDEFEPMAAVRQLLRTLRKMPLSGKVTLVPVVNEAAYRRGHRAGDDGLDLARTCPGRADGSPTEQVAHELSGLIRSADFYIDLHTGGTRLRVLPLAGYGLHPNAAVLEQQRRMAQVFGLPLIWGTDPSLNGRSLSVARDANVPAIYCEYHGGGRLDPAGVAAYVDGCLNVLAEFGLIEQTAGPVPKQTWFEDDRPGAGHMQINHPAPVEGFFEAAVRLGQEVRAGSLLGTISDVLGTNVHEIRAAYDGIVIVLHTFARIEAGTSVAVVIDIETMLEEPPI